MISFDDQRRPWKDEFLSAIASAPDGTITAEITAEERSRIHSLVREHVDNGVGFLLMTGLHAIESSRLRGVLLWLSRCLGEVIPQDAAGTLVREVCDRGTRIGEGRSARYADSRFGGNLHTDGAESPLPAPDYFVLGCVRQAKAGGALHLVSLDGVISRLSGDPEVLTTLSEEFHFDRRGDQRPSESATTMKPVVFRAWGRPAVTYLRKYIEVGHSRPEVPPLSARQRNALDHFDESLEAPGESWVGRMRPGEIAIFNNLRLLHGRTEFTDWPDPERTRLLYRTWIRRNPR